MTEIEIAKLNAKYSEFFVTRHSLKSGRQIMVGKPHKTLQSALSAARRWDERNPQFMSFIDIVRPQAT